MKNFPKWINTKKDIENLLSDPRFADQAKDWLKKRYKARKAYLPVQELDIKAKPVLRADQRIVVHEDTEGKPTKQVIEQLQVDPNSHWERLRLHEYESLVKEEANV